MPVPRPFYIQDLLYK